MIIKYSLRGDGQYEIIANLRTEISADWVARVTYVQNEGTIWDTTHGKAKRIISLAAFQNYLRSILPQRAIVVEWEDDTEPYKEVHVLWAQDLEFQDALEAAVKAYVEGGPKFEPSTED